MTTQGHFGIQSTVEFDTFDEALRQAGAETAATFATAVPGVLYTQGQRRFFTSSVPLSLAIKIARIDSAKSKDDPSQYHNRPLDPRHVKEIVDYLGQQDKFVLPPITLNASQPMRVFTVKHPTPSKMGIFLLSLGDEFYVTDGQHRLRAIAEALQQKRELASDAIGVTFIEEADLDQVHQDFVDCAQTAKISPALLVEYDGREPVNRLTRLVGRNTQVLEGKVEKVGNVGKTSSMLFTSNQVKQGILHALVGDWGMYATAMENDARAKIDAFGGADPAANQVVKFLDTFTEFNDQWRYIRDDALAGTDEADIPAFRASYLHLAGAGLLVICGVGHSILGVEPEDWARGGLSDEQCGLVEDLAGIDWSKSSDLWKGNLVGEQGNVTPHKLAVVLAVAKVKRELGISLTEREKARLRAAETVYEPDSAPVAAF